MVMHNFLLRRHYFKFYPDSSLKLSACVKCGL
uniref:Uncharacterized protein n=1 Tax=Arundo donax TaxID=35708 RepID=A0A0A8Z5P8_ARUDO